MDTTLCHGDLKISLPRLNHGTLYSPSPSSCYITAAEFSDRLSRFLSMPGVTKGSAPILYPEGLDLTEREKVFNACFKTIRKTGEVPMP